MLKIIIGLAVLMIFVSIISLMLMFPPKFTFSGHGYKNWERGRKKISKEEARKKYIRFSRLVGLVFLLLWIAMLLFLVKRMV